MTGEPRKDAGRDDGKALILRDPFVRAVRCPSGRVDVLGAALALVHDARPDANVAIVRETLNEWGMRLSRRILHHDARGELLTATLLLNRLLFEEEGFSGDSESPHEPANTELDLVLERRKGLPLTLGLLMVEVGKRAGLPLYGISFPGRFLVGLATAPRALLFDPFRGGRLVLPEECQGLLDGVTRPGLRLRPEFLAPCPPDRFVERMLTNLKHAYLRQAQIDAAIRVQGRLCDLRPDQPAPFQERARLRFQVGRHEEAVIDLERAALLATDDPSRRAVARQLDQVRRWIQAMRWRGSSTGAA
jgi:regulator of sirC expression with transglutaminase-like and TPR domain